VVKEEEEGRREDERGKGRRRAWFKGRVSRIKYTE
jgi:hypothetical protein